MGTEYGVCPMCHGRKVMRVVCETCKGAGRIEGKNCRSCNGRGSKTYVCSTCNGSGKVPYET